MRAIRDSVLEVRSKTRIIPDIAVDLLILTVTVMRRVLDLLTMTRLQVSARSVLGLDTVTDLGPVLKMVKIPREAITRALESIEIGLNLNLG